MFIQRRDLVKMIRVDGSVLTLRQLACLQYGQSQLQHLKNKIRICKDHSDCSMKPFINVFLLMVNLNFYCSEVPILILDGSLTTKCQRKRFQSILLLCVEKRWTS